MREIEFRGKRTCDGEWVYGHYFKQYGLHCITYNQNYCEEIDSNTVGQYSGMSELNSGTNRFYEGDILKGKEYMGIPGKFKRFIGEVIFVNGHYILEGVKQYKGLRCDIDGTFIKLGNKYDSPELVK